MYLYSTLFILHIIFAGGWLISFISDIYLKSLLNKNKGQDYEIKFIDIYLTLTNLNGIVSATGILITGILITLLNPVYTFFQFTANHWLTTKQILMVISLLLIFFYIIPTAKKLRKFIPKNSDTKIQLNEEGYNYLNTIFRINRLINLIVIINFILAITHRFIN